MVRRDNRSWLYVLQCPDVDRALFYSTRCTHACMDAGIGLRCCCFSCVGSAT